MKVLVTGATGFVGRHLVAALLKQGHEVRAVARNSETARSMPWFDDVQFIAADIHGADLDITALTAGIDVLAHLAWPGLPNYQGLFHFEENLPADYAFIKAAVTAGVGQVLVTGTCFEYGLQDGCLSESMAVLPANPYGLAKNSLRLFLQALQKQTPFTLQWARLFYLHGAGQNPNSLLAALDRAIDAGDGQFKMSAGEQLRDYLAIEAAAARLAGLIGQPSFDGVINCCSGRPVSVRALVEAHIRQRGATISLNLGHYPYSVHEPLAFWGDATTLNQLLGADHAS